MATSQVLQAAPIGHCFLSSTSATQLRNKGSSLRTTFVSNLRHRSPTIALLKSGQLTKDMDQESPLLGSQSASSERRRSQVKAGARKQEGAVQVVDAEDPAVAPPSTAAEEVDWTAVALPFVFPAVGGALFGYDIGATSGAVVSLKDAALSGTDWFDLSPLATGLVVSGSLGGALLGSILAYVIADPIGRRKELLLAASLYFIGALLMAFAPSLPALVAGRVAYGLGIGLAMHGAPMYIAETAPSKVRGTLISLKEAFIVGGILLGYVGGFFEIGEVGGWRWMYGLSAPAAILMGAGMLWLPESPRWLCLRAVDKQGDPSQLESEARKCLKRLRGQKASDASTDEQVTGILDALNADKGEDLGADAWKELLTGPNVKALTIGTGLVFFQQVTGQPSVLYYAATIFREAGFAAASEATKISVFLGTLKLAATMLSVFIVDKAGRRPLLLVGVSGICASLLALAVYYSSGQSVPIASVVALLIYVGCYQVSFGPISWLMVSEIFPLRVRGRALSVATLVNFGSNALVSFALPTVQEDLGQAGTFFTFFVIALVSLTFIYFQVPETKGLSLEEIEEQLGKN